MALLRDFAGLLISTVLAGALAYATELQVFAAVCLSIQWICALAYAIPYQDERYFDLTGSITFACVSALALLLNYNHINWRHVVLTIMVWFWCVRLGTFLFLRIRAAGCDSRFETIRTIPLRFLSVWSIQGLWVFLTLLGVLLHQQHAIGNSRVQVLDLVGMSTWAIGYGIEVLADYQKTAFRADPQNKDKFINSGLWYYSRHPNYFGEILMWIGIFAMIVHELPSSILRGLAALSPAFVTLLLTKVSGIPLLEKQADAKWGALKTYQEYKATTSVLVLLPKRK